jgi:hypothetical protein
MELTEIRFVPARVELGLGRLAGLVRGVADGIVSASGGVATTLWPDTTGSTGSARDFRALPVGAATTNAPKADPSVRAALDLIERVFGLNITELAEVCGATRKPIYDWRKGSIPRSEKLARIYDLRRAAVGWEHAGLGVPGAALRAPVIHEKSLFDLLRAETLDFDAIQFAGERLALKRELGAKRQLVDPFR